MTNYAKIKNNLVVNVIVADEEFIAVQEDKDDYKVLNRGGIGYTYNKDRDAFIAPKPFESWTLNNFSEWVAPKPYPASGGVYFWNEDLREWIKQDEK